MTTENPVLVNLDAKNRAWRTFLQGLAIDLAVAVATTLLVWLPAADLSSGDGWKIFGLSLAKTLIQTVAAYVMRKFVPPGQEPPQGDRGEVSGAVIVTIVVVVLLVLIFLKVFAVI